MASPPVLTLPSRLDVTEANDLVPFLEATRDQEVRLEIGALRRLDLNLLQLLILAVHDRQLMGGGLRLCGVTPAQEQRLQTLGMDQSLLPRDDVEALT